MRRILLFILLLLWSVTLLAGYFIYHKSGLNISAPLPHPTFPGWYLFVQQLLTLLRDFAVAMGITLVSLGLGRRLLGRFHMDGLDGLAIQTALGGGVFSLLWLALSMLGQVSTRNAWGALILLLIFLRKEILSGLQPLAGIKDYWLFAGKFERFFFAAAAVLALNQVWATLSPPVRYDALTYHLAIPAQIAGSGVLTFLPANPYWGHPQVAEMLFTWAIALGRAETAALTGWFFALVTFMGIARFTARWLPAEPNAHSISAGAGMSLIALLSGATARWMSGWAYTDLFSALMGLGGLSCLFAWRDSGRRGWILWMGVFTGLAVGTKYTAGVLALLLFPAALISPGRNRNPLWSILVSALISLAVFSPWAFKNLAFTGNPLFPYVFPTQYYTAARLAAANLPPSHVDWPALVALPISFTWQGIDNAPGSGTDLGPLLILLCIPGLILFRRFHRARILAAGLLLCWALIASGGARFDHLQQPRLYFAILPALACGAGWGWSALQSIQIGAIRLRRLLGVLFSLAVVFILTADLLRPFSTGALYTAVGLRSADHYLLDNTGVYYDAMRALAKLSPTSRILMLWEGRGLYAPQNAAPDLWLDRWRTDIAASESAENVGSLWRQSGYTHILLYADGMRWARSSDLNLSPPQWQEFDRLLSSLPPPLILVGDHYRLYSLP